MKKLPAITALALALISGLAQADRLEDIRKAGVLRVASFDSNPPFGFVRASRSKASTSTMPRPWPTSWASGCKCCRPTRPTASRC